MTPRAPETGQVAPGGTDLPAAHARAEIRSEIRILTKRAQFLAAARAKRQGTGGFMLQALHRNDCDPAIGVGFTCSKKVGNAVVRNRAKRRLREIARLQIPELGLPGWDYVLIGKAGASTTRDFETLQRDLRHALRKIHGPEK